MWRYACFHHISVILETCCSPIQLLLNGQCWLQELDKFSLVKLWKNRICKHVITHSVFTLISKSSNVYDLYFAQRGQSSSPFYVRSPLTQRLLEVSTYTLDNLMLWSTTAKECSFHFTWFGFWLLSYSTPHYFRFAWFKFKNICMEVPMPVLILPLIKSDPTSKTFGVHYIFDEKCG